MGYKEVSRVLGTYLIFFAGSLCIPLFVAFYCEFIDDPALHPQPHTTFAFVFSFAMCLALGGILRFLGRRATGTFFSREGILIVVLIWFLTALVSACPFWVSGTLEDPLDAYFEAMSGLTTTGATIVTPKAYDNGIEIPIVRKTEEIPHTIYEFYGNIAPVFDSTTGKTLIGVEAIGKALLLWRSFIQWLGGVGIVVLFLAILPVLGIGNKMLYQAEVPGPVKDAMTPRIASTASFLWKAYTVLTLFQILLLMITNHAMPLFDAICITFSTLSTGGFAIRNASIGGYQNAATEWVVIVFMILGGVNFAHYLNLAQRRLTRLWEAELIVYGCVLVALSAIISFALEGTPEELLTSSPHPNTFSWTDAVRYGTFQLVSSQTSTGFATANYNHWPYVCQVVMFIAMFIGGMSGSTAGGIKVVRHAMMASTVMQRITAIFRPHALRSIHVGTTEVTTDRALTVLAFFMIVLSVTVVGTFLLVVDGVDPQTAMTTIATMENNIGLGFKVGGPLYSFGFLSGLGKVVSILWMVAGRLEYFALLILFVPDFWRAR